MLDLLNVQDFIRKIESESRNNTEKICLFLQARGFLVEYSEKENLIYLSDNSAKEDAEDIRKILGACSIGSFDGERIVVNGTADHTLLRMLFYDDRICFPVDWKIEKDQYFRSHTFVEKVPTMTLETFVARYIKAISAAGVNTEYSCDGNHGEQSWVIIGIRDTKNHLYKAWHMFLWRNGLDQMFPMLDWNEDYDLLYFKKDTKFETYYYLNRAAALIYNKRKELRKIKTDIVRNISNNKWRKCPENAAVLVNEMFEDETWKRELNACLHSI